MGKNHLKRLNAPRKWRIKRKNIVFITRPVPGPHRIELSIPLRIIIRDLLRYANTAREVKQILRDKTILINGVIRKEPKFPVGLFDVMEIKETKEYFRVILDKKGKISLINIDKSDAEIRPCKVTGKTQIKGKTQLNLFDGSNIIVDKDEYKIADTLVLTVTKKGIKKQLAFAKKTLIYLTGGKHVGEVGVIEGIKSDRITYKIGDGVFETLKDYAFAIGEDKPLIKIKNEPPRLKSGYLELETTQATKETSFRCW